LCLNIVVCDIVRCCKFVIGETKVQKIRDMTSAITDFVLIFILSLI